MKTMSKENGTTEEAVVGSWLSVVGVPNSDHQTPNTRHLPSSFLLLSSCIFLVFGTALADVGATAADYYFRALHTASPEKRLELLDKAIKLNPNHVPALVQRAAAQSALGNEKLALANTVKAAELAEDDPEINVLAGSRARELKQYELAVKFYGRALAVDQANPVIRARVADALLKVRRIDEALEHAEALVERHPKEDFSYSIRAEAYEWANRYPDAVRDVSVLVERHPNEGLYYRWRSGSYRSMGDAKSALADAEKGIQLGGDPARSLATRGCAYEALGEYDKALRDYDKASDLDEDRRYYAIWSCLILRKQGKRADADRFIKDFRKGLKDDKWIAPVIKYLAGEMTEEEALRLAKHDDPETNRQQLCEAYYYIGASHLADKKLDKAEELFRKCLAQRVNNFYEHGFAVRDLAIIKKLREKPSEGNVKP